MSARQFLIAAMVAVVVGSKFDYYPLVFAVFVAMMLERPFPKASNLDSHWDFVVAVDAADFVVVVVVVFVFDSVVFANWVVQHVSTGPNLDSHRDFAAVFAVVVALAVVVVVVVFAVVFVLHVVAVEVLGCVVFVVEVEAVVVVVVVEVLGVVAVSLCLLAVEVVVVDYIASPSVVAVAVLVAFSATTRCIRSRQATHSRLLLLLLLRLIVVGVAPNAPILSYQSEISFINISFYYSTKIS